LKAINRTTPVAKYNNISSIIIEKRDSF